MKYLQMAFIPFIIRLIIIIYSFKFSIKYLGIFLGIIIGIIFLYIILQLYIVLMNKILNLEYVTGIEKVYITRNPKNGFHIVSLLYFSNYNQDEIYTFLYEYYICQIKRFRQKLTEKHLEFWYKEIPPEEAKKSITILNPFNSEEEILAHVQKEMNEEIDIFNDLPYKFQIAEIGKKEEKKGILIFKFEHVMTDGLGLIAALCCGASNYSVNAFPTIMTNMKDDTLQETIFFWCVYPLVLIHSIYFFFPMKKYKSPLVPKYYSNKYIISKSKNFKLKDFEKIRKENKISFNDLIVSVISRSMYNLINFKENAIYKDKKRMRIFLPITRKKLARNINEIDMENKTNLLVCDVPIIKDYSNKNLRKIRKNLMKYLKKFIQFAYIKTTTTLGTICSWPIFECPSQALCDRFELAFTNVPGPKIKIDYKGNVIEDIITFITPSRGLSFLTLISYNEQFSLTFSIDDNSSVKPSDFIDIIESELDELSHEVINIKIESENEDSSKLIHEFI